LRIETYKGRLIDKNCVFDDWPDLTAFIEKLVIQWSSSDLTFEANEASAWQAELSSHPKFERGGAACTSSAFDAETPSSVGSAHARRHVAAVHSIPGARQPSSRGSTRKYSSKANVYLEGEGFPIHADSLEVMGRLGEYA
jgi:hypothetical protein